MMRAIRAEKARRAAEAERERIAKDAERIRARCQTLAGFVREAWHVLEPRAQYTHGWHIDAICQHLEAVTDGRINRLLINVPPGSSKSLLVSVMWQAWEWGPRGLSSMRYLTTSFNDGPVKRDTRKCRDLMLSDWYRSLWPEVELNRTGETSFSNTKTGTREGVPFGSLTSQRGDRLVIDDPHSTETAESAADRLATTRKFREGAQNRLNDQEKSAIVVIMQRLHEEDVSGVIAEVGMEYVHLMLPMEFEPDRACETEIGFKDPRTEDGELLDPQRFPREAVEKLKRDMGSYAYAGQYQQRPAPRSGGMFQRGDFEVVDAVPAGAKRVRAWDFAASKEKPGKQPDWTVGLRMAYFKGTLYVEDVDRGRWSPNEVNTKLKNHASQDGPNVTIRTPQDPGAAGKADAETKVKILAGYAVKVVPPTGDKATRATPASAQAEAGNVKLVRGLWNKEFLDEVCSFPNGQFDDQVDAFADALNELALGSSFTFDNF
ncbi:phage terminase large subunit [Rhizobium gallicum]|uniref:phage terminase large subunit n=1 Tax=Rhizobium gallicum TaxID=56730 RepID=UPI001EF8885D|nr:phage terminase large subunit [Rhizobium gallicum]ULJ74047.1 phage terminase large subunit [Rhizobium gallicum]